MDYSFSKKSYTSLQKAAAEAVQRIYESGLSFRNGVLTHGHNNVRADNAAMAFTTQDLELLGLSQDPLERKYAEMITLRQRYAPLDPDSVVTKRLLDDMYELSQRMQQQGWTPRSHLVRLGSGPFRNAVSAVPEVNPDMNIDRAQVAALFENWDTLPDAAKGLLPDRKP